MNSASKDVMGLTVAPRLLGTGALTGISFQIGRAT